MLSRVCIAIAGVRSCRVGQVRHVDHGQRVAVQVEQGAHAMGGRAATPSEIAGPLLFLASDLSSQMTGEVLAVDGGAGLMGPFPDLKFGPAASVTP